MATHNNFLVKVTDATMPQVRKALQEAGIEVRSIISMHKEEIEEEAAEEETGSEEKADSNEG
ncbi:hypothetical protein EP232_02745 [bacterium]|nr:MAG: hypothetical protein EP232_02745 [bacterium]